jgi:hypothetical protein
MNVKIKILLFIALAAVVTIAAWFVITKKHEVTPETFAPQAQDTLHTAPATVVEEVTAPVHTNSYELYSVYPVELFDKTQLVFVSVSDRYPFNEHPDSLNIPAKAFKGKKACDAPHIMLQGIYRKRLLLGTGIKESDSLFVYNYAKDVLKAYPINTLKTSAAINAYSSEDEDVYQHYYQIGFELPLSVFDSSDDYNNLVYIGKENIFALGQMQPIHWADTHSKNLPSHSCKHQAEIDSLKSKNGNVFEYTQNGYHYYVQDGQKGDEPEGYVGVRHLLIFDSNKNVVTDLFLESSEGGSVAPLNRFSTNADENVIPQYTGKLFKDKPPIILGLLYASFGCESIEFLSRDETSLYINCDNRH